MENASQHQQNKAISFCFVAFYLCKNFCYFIMSTLLIQNNYTVYCNAMIHRLLLLSMACALLPWIRTSDAYNAVVASFLWLCKLKSLGSTVTDKHFTVAFFFSDYLLDWKCLKPSRAKQLIFNTLIIFFFVSKQTCATGVSSDIERSLNESIYSKITFIHANRYNFL